MDYNKSNRGVVCFFYNLMQKPIFFIALALFAALFAAFLKFTSFDEVQLGMQNVAFYALCVLFAGLLFISLNPKSFIIKLAGFLISLLATFVALHNTSELDSPLFYVLLAFGALLLYLVLSWFVYNARSSEINDL
ncbi:MULTISPECIES: hypothetical protein [unclassified Campylobacter]|uniref:hypothetical protein n=1 Tax=unclassified Campylobacter TaxID=2593542 RepID=UPI003D33288B